MKQQIRLTENQFRAIIEESVKNIIREMQEGEDVESLEGGEELEEGWLGDKFNQMKTAAGTLMQSSGDKKLGIADRFKAAAKNWGTQGELNDLNTLRTMLSDLLDKRKISPNTTVGALVGGKYNNGKFGTMSAMAANRKGQIANRGGQAR